MFRKIKVRYIEDYTTYKNKIYTAILHDLTQKYFAEDEKGVKIMVGRIENKKIILEKDFFVMEVDY